jgi:hypothetical protein
MSRTNTDEQMKFPEPEYAEKIVVGVVFHQMFAWYVTDKVYWYLDYTKYNRALLASGYKKPQWPLSRLTGEPMRFICQIALNSDIFGEIPERMAYLFITDDETFVDNTFDPDGGENAVIIQPGTCAMPTQPLLKGPGWYKMVSDFSEEKLWVFLSRQKTVGRTEPGAYYCTIVGSGKYRPYSLWDSSRYDLVIEDTEGQFWRVQCKTAWIEGGDKG